MAEDTVHPVITPKHHEIHKRKYKLTQHYPLESKLISAPPILTTIQISTKMHLLHFPLNYKRNLFKMEERGLSNQTNNISQTPKTYAQFYELN